MLQSYKSNYNLMYVYCMYTGSSNEEGAATVGPLRCYGNV